MSTNIYFILDSRKPDRYGKSPVKLRLSHNRMMADIPTNIRLFEDEWDAKRERVKPNSKSFENVTRINNQLQSKKANYLNQISELEEMGVINQLNARQLKERITDKPKRAITLYDFIDDQIKLKISAGKHGTAKTYQDLKRKLKSYTDKSLSFADINYNFLTGIEHKHISEGKMYSSLSIYLRTLRSLYNKAIKSGIAKKAHYPFNDYSIKNGEPKRRALSKANLKSLIQAEFKLGSAEQVGKDYYLASYYLQGMNWMDMCFLRYENFDNELERISYVRRKTGKVFNVIVIDKLKEIINRLKPIDHSNPKDFVFPVLDLECEESFYTKRIENRRLKINKYLHRIAGKLSIAKFSIYSARHTYATMLWEKSGSASIAQQSLGHQTEKQTQEYLSHFGNQKVDQAAGELFKDL